MHDNQGICISFTTQTITPMLTLLSRTVRSVKESVQNVFAQQCQDASQALLTTPVAIQMPEESHEPRVIMTSSSKKSAKRRLDLTDEAVVGIPSGKKAKAASVHVASCGDSIIHADTKHEECCIFSIDELVSISTDDMTTSFKAVAELISTIDFSPIYACASIVHNSCRQTMGGYRGGPRDVVKEFARFLLLKAAVTRCDIHILKPTCIMNSMWQAAVAQTKFYAYLKKRMRAYSSVVLYETSQTLQDYSALCHTGLPAYVKKRDIPLQLLHAVYKTYVGHPPLSGHFTMCGHVATFTNIPPRFSKHQRARRRKRFMKFANK